MVLPLSEAQAHVPARRKRHFGCAAAIATAGAIAASSAGFSAASWVVATALAAPGLIPRSGLNTWGSAHGKHVHTTLAAGERSRRYSLTEQQALPTKEIEITTNPVQPLSWADKPRAPTLPAGIFKPKPSLSQNFLADPNYIFKMVQAVEDKSPQGKRVLELGPGTGALTTRLFKKYPDMFAVEIDQRAMRVLAENVPGVTCVRSDVLLINYTKLAEIRGGQLNVIGNLPYHVSTQVLFTLADHAASVNKVHVTMAKQVAQRLTARPGTRQYGIPSVVFQLLSDPTILFDLPPTAFFPRPEVISSYVELDFEAAHERRLALDVDPRNLRNVTNMAFRQRRKFLGNSLEKLLNCHSTLIDRLPEEYRSVRAYNLEPWEFVHITQMIFGKKPFPRNLRLAWRGEFGRTVRDSS